MPITLRDKLNAAMQRSAASAAVPEAARQEAPRCAARQWRYPLACAPAISADNLPLLARDAIPTVELERYAFVDTETTGLSGGAGTLAFLVGIGRVRGDAFTVTQYWMRDYDEEEDMLRHVSEALEGAACVASFNGKSFDVPLLRSRMLMHRMRLAECAQLDLLFPARAMWKLRMPNVKLKTLEEQLLGLKREDDIPGAEIPALWFTCVKTRTFEPIETVLAHNAQDVHSLLALLMHMNGVLNTAEKERHPADLLSLGRVFERGARVDRARTLYRMAAPTYLGMSARTRLMHIARRGGNYEEAAAVLEQMVRAGQRRAFAHVELAKLYEHRFKDCARALRETEHAMRHTSHLDIGAMTALDKRKRRLERKLGSTR